MKFVRVLLLLGVFTASQAQTVTPNDDQRAALDEMIQLYNALQAETNPPTPPSILNNLAEIINKALPILDSSGTIAPIAIIATSSPDVIPAGYTDTLTNLRDYINTLTPRLPPSVQSDNTAFANYLDYLINPTTTAPPTTTPAPTTTTPAQTTTTPAPTTTTPAPTTTTVSPTQCPQCIFGAGNVIDWTLLTADLFNPGASGTCRTTETIATYGTLLGTRCCCYPKTTTAAPTTTPAPTTTTPAPTTTTPAPTTTTRAPTTTVKTTVAPRYCPTCIFSNTIFQIVDWALLSVDLFNPGAAGVCLNGKTPKTTTALLGGIVCCCVP